MADSYKLIYLGEGATIEELVEKVEGPAPSAPGSRELHLADLDHRLDGGEARRVRHDRRGVGRERRLERLDRVEQHVSHHGVGRRHSRRAAGNALLD